MPFQYQVEGLKEMIEAMDPAILSGPLKNFFQRVNAEIQKEARYYAPSDMGQLRNSIFGEVDSAKPPRWGHVGVLQAAPGTPLCFKARAMEYGTGRVGDKEVSHAPFHAPPGGKLNVWAKRHGFESGFAVARAIARRGGLIGRRYLRTGFALAKDKIPGHLRTLGIEVAKEWAKKAAGKGFTAD